MVAPDTGTFTHCNITSTAFHFPQGIVLNHAGTRIFIVNNGNDTVSQCKVNPATGAFSNCINTGGKMFNKPVDIALTE